MPRPPFVLNLLYHQIFTNLPTPSKPLDNQIYILTGANVGLAFEAAKHLVRLNPAKVILACRNLSKGEAAKKTIEAETGKIGVLEVWSLDLSSYESVKAFARKAETLPRIDALVESAGILMETYERTEDNESTITTNVVSTFLLAFLMLPKLRETAEKYSISPRITIVTSELHFIASFPESTAPNIFDALNDPNTKNMKARYPVSKLLEVLLVRELASQLAKGKHAADKKGDPPVIVNTPTPGWCWSEIIKNKTFPIRVMMTLIARTTEHGSRALCASALAGKESHGEYMSECVPRL